MPAQYGRAAGLLWHWRGNEESYGAARDGDDPDQRNLDIWLQPPRRLGHLRQGDLQPLAAGVLDDDTTFAAALLPQVLHRTSAPHWLSAGSETFSLVIPFICISPRSAGSAGCTNCQQRGT